MKRIKRFASLMLAMVMALAMTLTAFAAPEDGEEATYTITINNEATGHTYEAYQIFSGTLYVDPETSEKTLSDIVWGSGISVAGQSALGDAKTMAENLQKGNPTAADFAQTVSAYLTTASGTSGENDPVKGEYKISGLAAGYYLVKDQDGTLTSNDNYTTFILEVVGDAEATPKNSGTPTPDKSVKDKNDSDGTTTDWQDSADYDIGDQIDFELKATLPDTVTAYDKYTLIFHDKLCAGLDYVKDSAVVKLNGVEIADKTTYTIEYVDTTDKKELTVTFSDAKFAGNNSVITVEYKATLNDNAVVGMPGNENELTLEYSNNPNTTGNGDNEPTGTTPPVIAVVFTFETVVNKVENVDGQYVPLAGAEFTLQKYEVVEAEDGTKTEGWVDGKVATITGDKLSTFTFKGLDDGWYRLTESKVPNGYNKIEDIYFKVTAEHEEEVEAGKKAELKDLKVFATDAEGNELSGDNVTKFTVTLNDGNASTDILNQKGSVLPSTGGIGTTIFYVVGGILVVAAGILLVTKKRMSAR